MADYRAKLKQDLAEQFKDKHHIDALMDVIGKQLNDVKLFYDQLKTQRSIENAIGKQLDGAGDIVVLTRAEAARLVGDIQAPNELSDDLYRQYLMYKVLKNTCDCTYYDIMKAVQMFWKGPTLRYTEEEAYPATIIFDFDASNELADQSIAIPFIRAGGVGLYMRMHKHDELTIYYGVGMTRSVQRTIGCDVPNMNPHSYLTDENGVIMVDEANAWLIE